MKILLTGASGFIGQHLHPILETKHQVIPLENDLLSFSQVREEVIAHNPDVIVHLAARTEVEKSFYEPNSFAQVNYIGSTNLINAAAECINLKNFVFASTMEVYGWQPISDEVQQKGIPDNLDVAFDEKTVPHPNAPYAVAKLAVEHYLEYAHRSLGLPFTTIRQTNAYGRKDNDFFVTEQIITQMLKDPDNIYLGYAEPYRNFIFIDDLLDAWVRTIENPHLVNDGKIFTLGPNQPIKIRDYAEHIIAPMLNWKGTIHWDQKPKRAGEIYWLNSSNTLITETLGWQPTTSLDSGIEYTIDVWRNQI